MTPTRPSILARSGGRLAALRTIRAPFAALAALLVLVNLLLPTALSAAPGATIDAFGNALCSGFDRDGDPPLLLHCDVCCPAAGTIAPAAPGEATPVRFGTWRTPIRPAALVTAPVPAIVRTAPRAPPIV